MKKKRRDFISGLAGCSLALVGGCLGELGATNNSTDAATTDDGTATNVAATDTATGTASADTTAASPDTTVDATDTYDRSAPAAALTIEQHEETLPTDVTVTLESLNADHIRVETTERTKRLDEAGGSVTLTDLDGGRVLVIAVRGDEESLIQTYEVTGSEA
ncbi:hypothetical protein [Halostella salina]|uniref:hypothetical protein n=1 Tax=Halostella salina TaxID=1547897 RepID=UPI000EF811E7|nr:hypothetical protein [Halostella salina]